jgi:hypothetical protein
MENFPNRGTCGHSVMSLDIYVVINDVFGLIPRQRAITMPTLRVVSQRMV